MPDKTLARRCARDLLVKALYQWQLAGHDLEELIAQFSDDDDFPRCDQEYFLALLPLVIADVSANDAHIARFAERGLKHLDSVARAVLLLALTEMDRRPDVPVKVVINEAVELAKRYGATDSYRFVNALLDKVAKAREADRPEAR